MTENNNSPVDPALSESPRKERAKNDKISVLTDLKQLRNIELDLNSPRFKMACQNLGILPQQCILTYSYF